MEISKNQWRSTGGERQMNTEFFKDVSGILTRKAAGVGYWFKEKLKTYSSSDVCTKCKQHSHDWKILEKLIPPTNVLG